MDGLDKYLEELKAVLLPLGETQAGEICAEIRAHIMDSMETNGKTIDEVLAALGSAVELGAGYLGELGAGKSGAKNSDFLNRFREKLDEMGNMGAFGALGALGHMGALGHIGDMGKFGEEMGAWGEEFGKRMGEWGEKFGERMGHMGEELARKMEKQFDEGLGFPLTLTCDAHESVRIVVPGANVEIEPGPDDQVGMVFRIAMKGRPWGNIQFDPTLEDGVRIIDLSCCNGESARMAAVSILLPAEVKKCHIECLGGNISARETGCDLELHTCGGNVECSSIKGFATVEADAGNIGISDASGLAGARIETLAGNILVKGLPRGFMLDVATLVGSLEIAGKGRGTSWVGTADGEGGSGASGPGSLFARTNAGNIQIE